jgi:hypothetical protein
VVVVGVGIWLAVRDNGPSEPSAFLSPCGTVVRPPDASAAPTQRVMLIGDSIMAQSSCEVAGQLAKAGIETHIHPVPGTGLLTGWTNWDKELPGLLDSVHPNSVLAEFVGNYPPPPLLDDQGQPIARDSEEWFALWQQRATTLSRIVRDHGAKLVWVQAPPMDDGGRAARLFAGFSQLGDPTLPSGAALGGPAGQWIPSCGDGPPLRTADTIHLTQIGASLYGDTIARDFLSQAPAPTPCAR